MKQTSTVEHISNLAQLLDEPLQEKLWEYAELLYVEQVAFSDETDEHLTLAPNSQQREWFTFESMAR